MIEIDGQAFDLGDPEQKKAAIRAWLRVKAREKNAMEPATSPPGSPNPPPETPHGGEAHDPDFTT